MSELVMLTCDLPNCTNQPQPQVMPDGELSTVVTVTADGGPDLHFCMWPHMHLYGAMRLGMVDWDGDYDRWVDASTDRPV